MRHATATAIKRIRTLVRAGDCQKARQRFNALLPLFGSRGHRAGVHLKPKTVARLWGLVESCRWRPR